MLSDITDRRDPGTRADGKSEGRTMGIVVNAGKIPVFQRMQQAGLKSRKEKLERQQNRDNEVAVLEKQKADLKSKECGTLEDIEDKLELFHSYEDRINAVKQAFNNEQMHHILDEAREKGEKIAEELKKLSAKTPEEMKKILQEEALGIEENQGVLSELLEELTAEIPDELTGEAAEEPAETATDELTGEIADEPAGETAETAADILTGETTAASTTVKEQAESLTKVRIREAAEKIMDGRNRQ